ncbi:hypothetical protein LCM00_06960 [Bacillus infantis]|jgi:hypothetical protein|uniref:hypothetical protein n=1 Tax=Bacillus infantis TaxID=324767 RepID=UPI001CD481EF|nr:hypothetical protein [Bacillus infantis]MCA1039228.1 hypothetical protein [Bacillus infantis]MCR6609768.1 hypothetical protein [Bacillus infantis]
MFYPTFLCKETNQRHLVKDSNFCECGFKYKGFTTFIKKDFKKIQFKQSNDIDCPVCKSSVLKEEKAVCYS